MKTKYERTAYALRRMSKAVDRVIVSKEGEAWVNAWAKRAKVK